MSFLEALHDATGSVRGSRHAFYRLDREREVRGIASILRYLAEEDAIFEWQFGVRKSGMAG